MLILQQSLKEYVKTLYREPNGGLQSSRAILYVLKMQQCAGSSKVVQENSEKPKISLKPPLNNGMFCSPLSDTMRTQHVLPFMGRGGSTKIVWQDAKALQRM